jgi:integrase
MARQTLTDRGVSALKPRAKLYTHLDPQQPGLYIRIMPSGAKSYLVIARDPNKKQVWRSLGDVASMPIDKAREEARKELQRIKRAGPMCFEVVAEDWVRRVVDAQQQRDAYEVKRVLAKHIIPAWGSREFTSIRRGDVAKLQDYVEDHHGLRTSDKVLGIVSSICSWVEKRDDDYVSPIRKGMRRYSSAKNARERILTDDEIRALWDQSGVYADICKLALLTAQRREKVASIKWDDLDGNTWTIATEAREKSNARELTLPKEAMAIINRQHRLNGYVFSGRGGGHFAAWKQRDKIDRDGWRVHDLRRSAKSLMARAGVAPHISERVLGHAIRGVEGVYDRHQYREEKAHALLALADLIDNILRPPADKVVALRQ